MLFRSERIADLKKRLSKIKIFAGVGPIEKDLRGLVEREEAFREGRAKPVEAAVASEKSGSSRRGLIKGSRCRRFRRRRPGLESLWRI